MKVVAVELPRDSQGTSHPARDFGVEDARASRCHDVNAGGRIDRPGDARPVTGRYGGDSRCS